MLLRLHQHIRSFSAHAQTERFLAVNLAIGLGHFLVLFNGGAYLPMIPRIAASLGRNSVYGDWTQDLYFLALGLALPMARWVSGRFGDREGLLACFAVIAATSLVNASSSSYPPFLLARIVAGFAGGLSIPLSLNLLLRHYHADYRDHGLLLWGFAAITPFALGPAVGGWIDDAWGWRWLFLLNIPIALASFLGVLLWEEKSETQTSVAMDWVGYLLLCAAFVTMEMLLNLGSIDDWWRAPQIRFLFFLALILALAAGLWLRSRTQPAVDLDLFTLHNFPIAALGIWLTAVLFQGTLALFIVQYQLSFAFSAREIGFHLLPMALFAPLSAALSHWYLARHDPRWLTLGAMLILAVAAFWLSSYNLPASPTSLSWPPMLVGLGLGASFAAWARLGICGLSGPRELRAAGLLNLLRSSGQAMGIPAIAALWERRLDLHRHFLVEARGGNLSRWREALHRLTPQLSPAGARQHMAGLLRAHAAMIAFNEIYYVAGWLFLGLAGLSLLARRKLPEAEDTAEQTAIAELVEP